MWSIFLLVEGFGSLVVVRYDLSGWVEAKPFCSLSSQAVANFLWEDIIFDTIFLENG